MQSNNKTTTTLGVLAAGLVAISGTAQANPFSAKPLASGYGIAAPQGNCGADKGKKMTEEKTKKDGKCGADKQKMDTDKKMKKDASCGADKKKAMTDSKSKKEGSCGADKKKMDDKDKM